MEKAVIIRTKKQNCAQVKAWAYFADIADEDDLNDGDSDYREFDTLADARKYFEDDAELEPKNSNELWRKNIAAAAIEALGMTYKVKVCGSEAKYFADIADARDYLVDVEDSFIHSDADGARLSIRVEGDGKVTEASLTLADGEMWETERDDFSLFADGELL